PVGRVRASMDFGRPKRVVRSRLQRGAVGGPEAVTAQRAARPNPENSTFVIGGLPRAVDHPPARGGFGGKHPPEGVGARSATERSELCAEGYWAGRSPDYRLGRPSRRSGLEASAQEAAAEAPSTEPHNELKLSRAPPDTHVLQKDHRGFSGN